ncbi:MAG TPA: hypothetical protein VH394_17455 [Thermoanaerobaculia bacterium]|nr:hypothetical protein [Thermoanaerobaculia bacterium]
MTGPRLLPALLGLFLASTAAAEPAGPVCGSTNPLTLIGIDTTSGAMLFSAPAVGSGSPWLIELAADGSRARLLPDTGKGRFGGSVGPGPVLAATPCGANCLQPVSWTGSAWQPLGEPLRVPTATTISSTYDRTGTAWFLVQFPAQQDGSVQVEAFRLKGQDWESRGALAVRAMGQPAALPAPQRKDGVLVGTGLFSASGRPESWVTGVPSLPANRRGQLIALTGTSAAYLSADGVVYLSDDSGKRWRRSTWAPWGSPDGAVGIWRQGSDWWVDLPYGDHEGSLKLAWFDRRVPSEEKILLTRLTQSGQWVRLSEARSEISTRSEALPLSQILVPRGDTWLLLTGCVASRGTSSLVLRVFQGGRLSDAKLVKLE